MNQMSVLDKIMGVSEASELWGFSPDHIKKMCRDEDVNAVNIGNRWILEKHQKQPERKRERRGNEANT